VVARVTSFTQVMDVADFWNPTGAQVHHVYSASLAVLLTLF
jgi:hypothetical protein